MHVLLRPIRPHPRLAPHIEKFWVFESACGIPNDDMKIIVPNGLVKLIVPFRNGLHARRVGYECISPESSVIVVGVTETPFMIDAQVGSGRVGTIGVEFRPSSAYRFFSFPLCDTTNLVHDTDLLLGAEGAALHRAVNARATTNEKVEQVQRFLLHRLERTGRDEWVVDYGVSEIRRSGGSISMQELSARLGVSQRYVHRKFTEGVGVSPKSFASITRFQRFFSSLAAGKTPRDSLDRAIYESYFDQAHFIKDFKRFTGLTPGNYRRGKNDFGSIFYRQKD